MTVSSKNLWLAAGVCLLLQAGSTYGQTSTNEDDSNNDAVENDGGRDVVENDGNDGDDSSIGANPPSALIGCQSAYAYLASSEGLAIFKELIDSTDFETIFKYRNFTGTVLAPSNFAFRNFADATGINLETQGLKDQLVESLIQYHVVLDTIDPTTLAAQAGPEAYDTALALTPALTNSLLPRPARDVFFRDTAVIYEKVTITSNLEPGTKVADAPNGTFTVTAADSSADIIWDDTVEPVRTCVGYMYRVDNLLLPRVSLQDLASGGAPSLGPAGDENDGQNEGDGDLAPAPAENEGSEGEEGSEGAEGA